MSVFFIGFVKRADLFVGLVINIMFDLAGLTGGLLLIDPDRDKDFRQKLMTGINAHSVNLNMPYSDFIEYVLNKLNTLQIDDANLSGCGFELDNPMGSTGGEFLDARSALEIIPDMEGENGEVIVAFQGKTKTFGLLRRLGSTSSKKVSNILDMYQTYIIDRDYNIKRATIYFNGYFNRRREREVRLAKGFMFNKLGRAWVFNKVVE